MWSEFVPTPRHLFYQLLPREMALADIFWTPLKNQHYSDFVKRTTRQYLWLRANNYNFRIPPPSFRFTDNGRPFIATRDPSHNALDIQCALPAALVQITDPVPGIVIYYTLNGLSPNTKSIRYVGPIHVQCVPGKRAVVRSVAIDSFGRSSAPSKLLVQLKLHP